MGLSPQEKLCQTAPSHSLVFLLSPSALLSVPWFRFMKFPLSCFPLFFLQASHLPLQSFCLLFLPTHFTFSSDSTGLCDSLSEPSDVHDTGCWFQCCPALPACVVILYVFVHSICRPMSYLVFHGTLTGFLVLC